MEEKKKKIIIIIIWIVLFIWMVICFVDYNKTRNEKRPLFCLNRKTLKYDDGNIDVCYGFGYKIYHYNRATLRGFEYGPIWLSNKGDK